MPWKRRLRRMDPELWGRLKSTTWRERSAIAVWIVLVTPVALVLGWLIFGRPAKPPRSLAGLR